MMRMARAEQDCRRQSILFIRSICSQACTADDVTRWLAATTTTSTLHKPSPLTDLDSCILNLDGTDRASLLLHFKLCSLCCGEEGGLKHQSWADMSAQKSAPKPLSTASQTHPDTFRICIQSNHSGQHPVRGRQGQRLRGSTVAEESARGVQHPQCCPSLKACQDKLIDPSSVTYIFKLSPSVGCVMTGSISDARNLVQRARAEAAEFRYKYGYEMPCDVLAKRLANMAQAYMRPLGVATTLISLDSELGPSLYKTDPAGYFTGYKAIATGPKNQEAMNHLEKKLRDKPCADGSWEEVVELGITAMSNVLSVDFKKGELEIGIVGGPRLDGKEGRDPQFRALTEEEIDERLQSIAEKD
ncbi:hypothetical protein MRB53_036978 [Persea americana]|nr:hypothetical protein MRB53_036978 [Persea americana]